MRLTLHLLFLAFLSIATSTSIVKRHSHEPPKFSLPAVKKGCLYEVPGVGGFTHTRTYTFEDGVFPAGLVKSNNFVGKTAKKSKRHRFLPEYVQVRDGYLQLEVPGGQAGQPYYKCGEVSTIQGDILYASVRTTAIFSDVPGTVHGNFFYRNDSQEIDIEYLTDPKSLSNPPGLQPLMFTNQALNNNPADATSQNAPSPYDRTTVAHEYRIDWVKGKSLFYRDAKHVRTFTTNVPTQPGNWFWNNWSSGDKGFSAGPPAKDNFFKLAKIVMYFNTTSSAGTC